MVTESASATGGITAVIRALPASTRAWTIGLAVSIRRSVSASILSTTCRFSSRLVGWSRLRSRPLVSKKVTLGPSMKISSTSVRSSSSVIGPKSANERSILSTIPAGWPSALPSPRWTRC